jgi:hypothetical protein
MDPIYLAIERYKRTHGRGTPEAAWAAREILAKTKPTTKAGLIALLDLAVAEQNHLEAAIFEEGEETMWFIESLSNSIRALLGQGHTLP